MWQRYKSKFRKNPYFLIGATSAALMTSLASKQTLASLFFSLVLVLMIADTIRQTRKNQ